MQFLKNGPLVLCLSTITTARMRTCMSLLPFCLGTLYDRLKFEPLSCRDGWPRAVPNKHCVAHFEGHETIILSGSTIRKSKCRTVFGIVNEKLFAPLYSLMQIADEGGVSERGVRVSSQQELTLCVLQWVARGGPRWATAVVRAWGGPRWQVVARAGTHPRHHDACH